MIDHLLIANIDEKGLLSAAEQEEFCGYFRQKSIEKSDDQKRLSNFNQQFIEDSRHDNSLKIDGVSC